MHTQEVDEVLHMQRDDIKRLMRDRVINWKAGVSGQRVYDDDELNRSVWARAHQISGGIVADDVGRYFSGSYYHEREMAYKRAVEEHIEGTLHHG